MASAPRTLYQFPISHYCEKTRWNLEAKGLSYRIENLLPGPHRLVTKRLTKGGVAPCRCGWTGGSSPGGAPAD